MRPEISRNAPIRRVAARQRLERLHQRCERRQQRKKKAGGLLVAAGSVAALMGIAYLKARADNGKITESTAEPITE